MNLREQQQRQEEVTVSKHLVCELVQIRLVMLEWFCSRLGQSHDVLWKGWMLGLFFSLQN